MRKAKQFTLRINGRGGLLAQITNGSVLLNKPSALLCDAATTSVSVLPICSSAFSRVLSFLLFGYRKSP